MADIIFPTSSAPGARIQDNGGRLINAMTVPASPGARKQMRIIRVPGLTERVTVSDYANCRGMLLADTRLLVAMTDRIVKVTENADGTLTWSDLTGLDGSDKVTWAINNAATPDIVVVSEAATRLVLLDSSSTTSPDTNLPNGANSVCFQAGYFFWTFADGTCYASGLNATTVDALDMVTYNVTRGGLLRGIPYDGRLYLFGPHGCGIYTNTGNASGFPYSFGAEMDIGLASTFAIAGHEEGWINKLFHVGEDDQVYRVEGFQQTPVSTPAVVRAIQSIADKTTLEACVYMAGENAIWSLKSPSWCWEYNVTTSEWHERRTYDQDTWRGQCSVQAFGDWLCGEAASGKLYAIRQSAYADGADELVWEVRSVQGHAFPQRIRVPRADFDFEAGVGEADGASITTTNPRVEISWSDDGGATFSQPLTRELGAEGEYRTQVTLMRTGLTGPKGRQWRLVCSDPVPITLMAGVQDARLRAA